MRIVVVGLVLLSLSAAGGTMFLVKKFLDSESQNQTMSASNQETSEPEEIPSVFVLTTDTDLAAGTTVKKRHLKWLTWPEDMVSEHFITSTKD